MGHIMKHRTEFLKGFEKAIADGCKLSVCGEPMTTADRFFCRIQDAISNHDDAVFLAIHDRMGELKAFLSFSIVDDEAILRSFSRLSQDWFVDFIEKCGFNQTAQTN